MGGAPYRVYLSIMSQLPILEIRGCTEREREREKKRERERESERAREGEKEREREREGCNYRDLSTTG